MDFVNKVIFTIGTHLGDVNDAHVYRKANISSYQISSRERDEMHIQSIHKVKGVKKHGEAIYRELLCASREESSNEDEQSVCLKTMWKLWHTTVPPGITLEPHAHKRHEQIYFIIEGTGIVSVGGEKRRVNSGDAIYLPPDISHSFVNDSDKPCAMICVGANIFHASLS